MLNDSMSTNGMLNSLMSTNQYISIAAIKRKKTTDEHVYKYTYIHYTKLPSLAHPITVYILESRADRTSLLNAFAVLAMSLCRRRSATVAMPVGGDLEDRIANRKLAIASKLLELEKLLKEHDDDRTTMDEMQHGNRRDRSRSPAPRPGPQGISLGLDACLADAVAQQMSFGEHVPPANPDTRVHYMILGDGRVIPGTVESD